MTIVMIDGDAVLMTDADAEALPGLSPQSRAEIFGASSYWEQRADEARHPWLTDWSARHGAAPNRWKAWTAAGRPTVDRRSLCIVGERPIVDAFRSMLAQVPEAVAWYVIGHVFVVCGGQENAGSCGGLPMLPPAPPRECHLIQMHAANEETAAHEVGHAFTIEPPTLCSRFNAVRCEELRAAAIGLTVMRGQLDAYEDEIFLRERAADRLASLWLGRAVDTTSGACGKRRRQVMARDVDRDLERAIAVGGGSTR